MNKEEFINELKKINIDVTDKKLEQLDKYYKILVSENEKYNLTAITEEKQVYLKHFYDSLTIFKMIELENQTICDIGTGAGFPGMVLKIFFPNLEITLLDATSKKCQFLENVIKELGLTKINVVNARAEEYSHKVREHYDLVVSRAVAPLKHLLEYSIPLLKKDGYFIAMKSSIAEEMQNIDNYYKKLHLSNEEIIEFTLPIENSKRTIYRIQKMQETDNRYPRQYKDIKKRDI
jgi:16S rRNA (guanine527-N7)-methyltransferase